MTFKKYAELNYTQAIQRLKALNETPPEVNNSAIEQKKDDNF